MPNSKLALFWSLLPLLVVAGCGGPGSQARSDLGAPVTIPAGEGFWIYTETSAQLRDANGPLQPASPLPSGAGRPVDASLDLESGWGVIAYEHFLGVVQLAEGEVSWHTYAGPRVDSVGVRGDLFTTLCGDDVAIWRVADGKLVRPPTSARVWLESQGLDEVRIALPISERELLLVGHHSEGFASPPKTTLARVDVSQGNWMQLGSENLSVQLHDLDIVSSDGSAVFLAGKLVADRGRGKLTMDQCLIVLRYDVAKRETRTLVQDDRLAAATRVLDIAAGKDLVAIILDGYVLNAYRVYNGGDASTRVLHDTAHPLAEGSRLGWASDREIVAISPAGTTELRRIP